jgi:ribokinase
MNRLFVVGNVAEDATFAVEQLPGRGASIFGTELSRDLGGKGANQAIVVARAGVETRLIAATGADTRGRWIRDELEAESLSAATLVKVDSPSDLSIILVTPDGDNSIITTTAAAERLTENDVCRGLEDAHSKDVLLLQGNLSLDLTRFALERGKKLGMFTTFNPSPVKASFASLWPHVDLAVMNRVEALALSRATDPDEAAIGICAAGAAAVIVTLGPKGALLQNASGRTHVPASRAIAIDTTGAGDTFIGALIAYALIHRTAVGRRAVEAGVDAATLTISRRGTRSAFPTRTEMRTILHL